MTRPRLDVAEVIRSCYDEFLERYGAGLTPEQRRALDDLTACRTAALGGHVLGCPECGYREISYTSCGNRHCPKCHGTAAARWLEAQAADLLDVPYFHVVFTLPRALNPIALANPREVYGLLLRAAAETLIELAADPKHLGAEIGVLAVLHTWGQDLELDPHVDRVVPGGGPSPDGARWIGSRPGFFRPVRVLSRVSRGKFLAGLRRARTEGKLRFAGSVADLADERAWAQWLAERYREDWVVYSQPPCAGAEVVLKYLARYTHRVALSNSRLVRVTEEEVTFTYKDYRQEGQTREMTLDVEEFARRFLQHVLPRGFVRIRHYGLLANRGRDEKLRLCRHLLLAEPVRQAATAATEVTEVRPLEPWVCPGCGRGEMRLVELLGRAELAEEEPAWEDSS